MTNKELKDRIMSGISESLMTVLGNGNSLNELKSETLNRAANKAAHFGDIDRAERFRNYAKEIKDGEVKVSTFDDVPDLGYSRSMETECYGQRTTQVTVSLSDGRKVCIFA